jgi:hypothetical protein
MTVLTPSDRSEMAAYPSACYLRAVRAEACRCWWNSDHSGRSAKVFIGPADTAAAILGEPLQRRIEPLFGNVYPDSASRVAERLDLGFWPWLSPNM